ncbi:MAG: hypothetical protein ACK6EB_03980, partial [Planctomyces sp.]
FTRTNAAPEFRTLRTEIRGFEVGNSLNLSLQPLRFIGFLVVLSSVSAKELLLSRGRIVWNPGHHN